MSKESEFWRLIGVQPNEKFKIQDHRGKISKNIYYFTHLMELRKENGRTNLGLYDILSGRNKIIKIKELSDEDKIIVKYLRLCGYAWVAKDKDGKVHAFDRRPTKTRSNQWCVIIYGDYDYAHTTLVEAGLSILDWENEEPTLLASLEE